MNNLEDVFSSLYTLDLSQLLSNSQVKEFFEELHKNNSMLESDELKKERESPQCILNAVNCIDENYNYAVSFCQETKNSNVDNYNNEIERLTSNNCIAAVMDIYTNHKCSMECSSENVFCFHENRNNFIDNEFNMFNEGNNNTDFQALSNDCSSENYDYNSCSEIENLYDSDIEKYIENWEMSTYISNEEIKLEDLQEVETYKNVDTIPGNEIIENL